MSAERQAVGTVERILLLRRFPMVGGLPPEELAVLADAATEKFFDKDAVLLREGEAVPAVYMIVEGDVHMDRGGRFLGHALPGHPVGGLAFLARDTEGIGAVAHEKTLALELEADALMEVFEDRFAILHHLLREVCRELERTLRRFPEEIALRKPGVIAPLPDHELDLVERIMFLRRANPFRGASVNALAELSRAMTEVRLPPGVEFWKTGDPAGWVSMIMSGEVACTVGDFPTFNVGQGMPLGALESMAEHPRWYRAVTATNVTTLRGNVETLIDVFEDNFDMAMTYISVMAGWLLYIALKRAGPGITLT